MDGKVRSALGLWSRFVFGMVVNECVNEACNGVSRVVAGVCCTRLTSDHCGLLVSQISNFPTSSVPPAQGGCPATQAWSPLRVRTDAEQIAHAKIVRSGEADWCCCRCSFAGGDGASPPLRGQCRCTCQPAPDTPGSSVRSPKRQPAWLNSGGASFYVSLCAGWPAIYAQC